MIMYIRLHPERVKYTQAKSPEDFMRQRTNPIPTETGCLLWLNAPEKDGYGQVQASPHSKALGVTRAHQMAYVIAKGPYLPGQIICHTCDNPTCVNPDHLYAGSWKDNVHDCVRRGRYRSGSVKKLPYEQIVSLHGGMSCEDVAAQFSASFSAICRIWRLAGKTGKHFHKGKRIGIHNPE